jgi:hypothetical protein
LALDFSFDFAKGETKMAVVWGSKKDGTTGSMTADDIFAFLDSKAGWQKSREIQKAYKNCASYLLNYKDSTGGGTVYHFNGKMVKHVTENRGEVTFFFTHENGIVSIVGIGEHSGPNSATAEYTLKWHSKSWIPRNSKGQVVKKVELQWSGKLPKQAESVRPSVVGS